MGGFVLESTDHQPFPISAKQMVWLVKHQFIDMPEISVEEINDRNKVDGLGRYFLLPRLLEFH